MSLEEKTFKVYLIEDEPVLCELFLELFSEEGIEISTFTSPLEALTRARDEPPNLYFIDYRLPEMSGDELAQSLTDQAPKYLLTGDLNAKAKHSFNEILSKPFDVNKIKSIICSHVENYKRGLLA